MKTIFTLTLLFISVTSNLFAQKLIQLDIKNSVLKWTGHAEIGTYAPTGTLSFNEGTARLERGAIKSAELSVDMKSMKTDNLQLLGHLTSADFFEVSKFPVSTITIDRLINGEAVGKLTIKNVSKPFHCPVTIQQDKGNYKVSGAVIIDRTAYGIIYNSGNFFSGLGDKAIRNTFDIAFTIYFTAGDQ